MSTLFLFSTLNFLGTDAANRVISFILSKGKENLHKLNLTRHIRKEIKENPLLVKDKVGLDYVNKNLIPIILKTLFNESSLKLLLSVNQEERDEQIKDIYAQCVNSTCPKGKLSEQDIKLILNECYCIIDEYYFKKIEKEDLELGHLIIESINAHADKNKEEIKAHSDNNKDEIIAHTDECILELKEFYIRQNSSQHSDKQHSFISDNRSYYGRLNDSLFLDSDNPNITLKSTYIEPMVQNDKDEMISFSECMKNWQASTDLFMLLYGEAGVGKSSLVSILVYESCQACDLDIDNADAAPVLAVALRDHCDIFRDYISNSTTEKDVVCKLFGVDEIPQLNHKLLILDGLDELVVLISEFNNDTTTRFIHNLCKTIKSKYCDIRIVFTSRKEGYFNFDDFSNCPNLIQESLCWTDKQVLEWCNKYSDLKPESKKWCMNFLEQYSNLPRNSSDKRYEILCIPFIVYLCSNTEVDLERNHTICQVYDQVFRNLLTRKHSENLTGSDSFNGTEDIQRLVIWQYAKELAYQMLLQDTLTLSNDSKIHSKETNGLQRAKARTKKIVSKRLEAEGVPIEITDKLLAKTKFLAVFSFARNDGKKGITFVHKSVCEYFSAVKLYEDYFAGLTEQHLKGLTEEQKISEVINKSLEAFRYKAISSEIFKYLVELCTNAKPLFGVNTTSKAKWFSFDFYQKLLLKAFGKSIENKMALASPIEEYIYSVENIDKNRMSRRMSSVVTYEYSSICFQISRAFNNLTWFLSLQGFNNSNDDLKRWSIETLFVPSDQRANMRGWDFHSLDLRGIYLAGAYLSRAIFAHSNLKHANLDHCILVLSDFSYASLFNVKMQHARLLSVNLKNAYMPFANLRHCDLRSACLIGTNLKDSNLREARLWNADLRNARLSNADLRDADFWEADLRGANLRGAVLMPATNRIFTRYNRSPFQGAKYSNLPDFCTIFPDGFNPEDHGMILCNDIEDLEVTDES